MNLDVAILSGISFNRLHFMVMWPVPCRAMCTYTLHMHGLTCTNPQSQTNTHLPALIKTMCPYRSLSVYYAASSLHRLALAPHLCLLSDEI